jgi:diguanylate cyclase
MLRIIACVTQEHDLRLVAVAALVCALTTYTAVIMLQRAQAVVGFTQRLRWLAFAAVATGAGVWSTHFVAMLAFKPNLPIGYEPGLTLLSIAIAIAVAGLGMGIALYRPRLALLGGAVVGAGVGSMHFTGMAAMRVQADVHWDAAYVLASLAIGVAMGALALWRVTAMHNLHGRLQGAMLLILAICGLHFTAMAAATLEPQPAPLPLPEGLVEPANLAFSIAAVTIIIIAHGLASVLMDRRAAARA